MTENNPISPELLDSTITQALEHVFPILVKKNVLLVAKVPSVDVTLLGSGSQIMGCVGFLGDVDGFVHLRMSESLGWMVAGLILGMSPQEVQSEGFDLAKDSLGELTNMTVGNFKNRLCDRGFPCKLTLPTIVRGEQLSVPTAKGALRQIYHFEVVGQNLFADLQIKAG